MTDTIDAILVRPKDNRARAWPALVSLLAIARMVTGWLAAQSVKRRSRQALRDLTDDQLCDVGLTRHDVKREVAKSFFWD